jgi:hypothetical protein
MKEKNAFGQCYMARIIFFLIFIPIALVNIILIFDPVDCFFFLFNVNHEFFLKR